MAADFDAAMEFVFAREGGYVNDSRDPGGETAWGITFATLQDSIVSGIVPSGTTPHTLTRDQARAIYRARYWDAIKADQFKPAVALVLFDSAVNQGPITAVRLLQQSLGVTADGIVGPETIRAAAKISATTVIQEHCALRLIRYRRDANAETYFGGWCRRVLALHAACLAMENS